jgi:hypothetical protein
LLVVSIVATQEYPHIRFARSFLFVHNHGINHLACFYKNFQGNYFY